MPEFRVLYTDSGMGDIDVERDALKAIDAEIVMCPGTDENTLIQYGCECDGVMVEYARITEKVIESWAAAGKVRIISRQGIGVNNIDIEAAGRNGIMVANVPDYCIEEVADHAMTLALCAAREIKGFDRRVERGEFAEEPVRPINRLRDRNFCLYGFGNIAGRVAERARAFGFHVCAYDPFLPDEAFENGGVTRVDSLLELARISDVFSIHAPLVDSTFHSVNRELFQAMKQSCIVVNTSRGPLVNEADLIEALEKGWIAGAGLDVFEEEPPAKGLSLLHMDNVVVTPHVSFYSEEAKEELRRGIAENVLLALRTGHPKSLVNKHYFKTINDQTKEVEV